MSAASDFAKLRQLPVAGAIDYMRGRADAIITHDWQELWQDEHAQQFTISRLTRLDLLQSIRDGLQRSVDGDLSRRDWMRDTEKLLKDAGWWGQKQVVDPETGKLVTTTFDPARLKLIYDTNTRQAYATGQWERVQAARRTHPYIRYVTMDDDRVRPAHRAWHNLVLPVEHAFWSTHWPPNGWRCRCRVVAISQRDYDAGSAPSGAPLNKQPPPDFSRQHVNRRTGEITQVPNGVDPGFGYNAGKARQRALEQITQAKLAAADKALAQAARKDGLFVLGAASDPEFLKDFERFIRGELPGQRAIAVIPEEVGALLNTRSEELLLSATTARKQFQQHPEISVADYAKVQEMLNRGEIIKDRDLHIGIIHQSDGWYYAVIKVTKTGVAVYIQSLRRTNLADIERLRARGEVLRAALQ